MLAADNRQGLVEDNVLTSVVDNWLRSASDIEILPESALGNVRLV
jgi:hypothetical protein